MTDTHISCCICLNQGKRTQALLPPVAGYAVCGEHRAVVSEPGFDIFTLVRKSRAF